MIFSYTVLRISMASVVVFGCCLPCALAASNQDADEPPGEIVARVGTESVSRDELDRAIRVEIDRRKMQARATGQSLPPQALRASDAQRRALLDALIDAKVLHILAREAGVSVSDETVETELKAMKEDLGEERFQAFLASQNLTFAELRERIRRRNMNSAYVEMKTRDVTVSDDEVRNEYERLEKAGKLERPADTAEISQIQVGIRGNDDAAADAAKEKIDKAFNRLEAGEDFAKVADDLSEDRISARRGGKMPPIAKGSAIPEFEERAFSLPLGKVSEPFKTKYGWHIIRVDERHEAGTVPFDEAKDAIRLQIETAKRVQAIKQLIEEARKKLEVEIYLELPGEENQEELPTEETPPVTTEPDYDLSLDGAA